MILNFRGLHLARRHGGKQHTHAQTRTQQQAYAERVGKSV
jgi:hypothetical protein